MEHLEAFQSLSPGGLSLLIELALSLFSSPSTIYLSRPLSLWFLCVRTRTCVLHGIRLITLTSESWNNSAIYPVLMRWYHRPFVISLKHSFFQTKNTTLVQHEELKSQIYFSSLCSGVNGTIFGFKGENFATSGSRIFLHGKKKRLGFSLKPDMKFHIFHSGNETTEAAQPFTAHSL